MTEAFGVSMRASLQDKMASLPSSPGVYLLKDEAGKIVYVGKGKNLKRRVQSYSSEKSHASAKTRVMLAKVADLEVLITASEKEALILEANLIKKYRPRYNVVLRDDKRYLCLRIDPREEYPRLSLVRRTKKDGALYFGPFASAHAVRNTVRALNRAFPLRQCRGGKFRQRQRPCLNHQMGRCLGLCVGNVSRDDYALVVEQAVLFLKGRTRDLQDKLREEMQNAAEALEFEKAAIYRDRLKAVEETLEKQLVASINGRDQDVIGVRQDLQRLALAVLFIRGGRLIGSRIFDFNSPQRGETEAVTAFIQQYYQRGSAIPDEILVSDVLEEQNLLAEWLSDLKGKRVTVRVPKRGNGRYLVEMAVRNAANFFLSRKSKAGEATESLKRLRDLLQLDELPQRIECVDISNIQGQFAVGSLVVFEQGQPHKAGYRRYRIRDAQNASDTAMIAEVLRRRFTDGHQSEVIPDLLVVDGGKAQLNQALAVLEGLKLHKGLPVVGLAKKVRTGGAEGPGDRLYLPGRKNPLPLNREPSLLFLLGRLRDEAHRFAISYYQKRHRKELLQSRLDELPGVGPKRRQALMRNFGSLTELALASAEEISRVAGISGALADRIWAAMQEYRSEKPQLAKRKKE